MFSDCNAFKYDEFLELDFGKLARLGSYQVIAGQDNCHSLQDT